jgi:hypothetical protein
MNPVSVENDRKFSNEMWEAEVLGKIYETNLEELTRWIGEGALLPEDKVRRGNLRWLEAGKVPPLIPFFNAKADGSEPPPVQTAAVKAADAPPQTESFQIPTPAAANAEFGNDVSGQRAGEFLHAGQIVCIIHPEEEAKYLCETCENLFCRHCPNSYGGSVKICPMCGAMCRSLAESAAKKEKEHRYNKAIAEGFGFSDFGKALAHPFKFKTSLFFGALMFMFFTLGQSAGAFGGLFMVAAAIFCFMLANMLTFGVLANTIDNFTKGNLDANFMPSFDDFSLWDDVVHPFFLSVGAYISAFGPLILIVAVSVYMIISSLTAQMNTPPEEIARMTYPGQTDEQKVAAQSEQVKKILETVEKEKLERLKTNEFSQNNPRAVDETEENVRQADELIGQMRREQLESAIGKSPETLQKENEMMLNKFLAMGSLVLFLAFLAFLWGIFYFPAACAVAGYTRSFTATINPLVGLDTIKRLGADYAKIWLMGFLIVIFTGVTGSVLAVVLSPFDMPRMGNLPATAIGSLFTFYFSVVFSCILGCALYKASDRLNLYKG